MEGNFSVTKCNKPTATLLQELVRASCYHTHLSVK